MDGDMLIDKECIFALLLSIFCIVTEIALLVIY